MAVKEISGCGFGPYLYDDAEVIDNAASVFDGMTWEGAMLEGQAYIGETPTEDHHVVRLVDAIGDLEVSSAFAFFVGTM